jgi:hypothetical protein
LLLVLSAEAVVAYHGKNGEMPERIIFFRDGVDQGDLEYVYNTELVLGPDPRSP